MNTYKSICLFSSFFSGSEIPYYVKYYVTELKRHFDEILFLTTDQLLSEDSISFLKDNEIQLMQVANEGYDFGMWYKALLQLKTADYNRIGLVNDSCILFRSLDKEFDLTNPNTDSYYGMVISDRFSRHVQSYFILIQNKAISYVADYFKLNGIIRDYRTLIQVYEIGLCKYLLEKGISVEGFYNKGYESFPENPSFARIEELIDEGIPMIKKKIVFRNYRGLEYYWLLRMKFSNDFRKYFRKIRSKYKTEQLIDLDRVLDDAPKKSLTDVHLYKVILVLWKIFFSIPGTEWVFNKLRNLYKRYFRKEEVNTLSVNQSE